MAAWPGRGSVRRVGLTSRSMSSSVAPRHPALRRAYGGERVTTWHLPPEGECPGGDELVASTVLVVEDETKLRELLRSYFEREGMAVLSTGSGSDAIALARRGRPDLVILDLGLPDVPGEDVVQDLRTVS